MELLFLRRDSLYNKSLGDWVRLTACLDILKQSQLSWLCRDLNLEMSSRKSNYCTNHAIPIPWARFKVRFKYFSTLASNYMNSLFNHTCYMFCQFHSILCNQHEIFNEEKNLWMSILFIYVQISFTSFRDHEILVYLAIQNPSKASSLASLFVTLIKELCRHYPSRICNKKGWRDVAIIWVCIRQFKNINLSSAKFPPFGARSCILPSVYSSWSHIILWHGRYIRTL